MTVEATLRMQALALEWKPAGFVGKPFSQRELVAAPAAVVSGGTAAESA